MDIAYTLTPVASPTPSYSLERMLLRRSNARLYANPSPLPIPWYQCQASYNRVASPPRHLSHYTVLPRPVLCRGFRTAPPLFPPQQFTASSLGPVFQNLTHTCSSCRCTRTTKHPTLGFVSSPPSRTRSDELLCTTRRPKAVPRLSQ